MKEKTGLDYAAEAAMGRLEYLTERQKGYREIDIIYEEMLELIIKSNIEGKNRQIKRLQYMLNYSHYLIGKGRPLDGTINYKVEDIK